MKRENGFNPEQDPGNLRGQQPQSNETDLNDNVGASYLEDPLGLLGEFAPPKQIELIKAIDSAWVLNIEPYSAKDMEKIYGAGLTKEEKEKLAQSLRIFRERGANPLENEIEKGPEYVRYVALVNDILNDELANLGVDKRSELTVERYHLMSVSISEDETKRILGQSISLSETVHLYGNHLAGKSPLQIISVMLHEAIHANAFERVVIKNGKHFSLRSGYEMNYEVEKGRLTGLNEAVVEKLTIELLEKNKDRLNEEFKFTDEDWENLAPCYTDQMDSLNKILFLLHDRHKLSEGVVWEKFKKGEFTGQMIHLKEAIKILTPGEMSILETLFE
jgi:hypothetical protein